jgi:hypothetical protein
MTDPNTNSVRVLAGRYHLSMKRVDAILRLKGLEEHWKQVRTRSFRCLVLSGARYVMSVYRLVFKTSTWLNIENMHGFLILSCSLCIKLN